MVLNSLLLIPPKYLQPCLRWNNLHTFLSWSNFHSSELEKYQLETVWRNWDVFHRRNSRLSLYCLVEKEIIRKRLRGGLTREFLEEIFSIRILYPSLFFDTQYQFSTGKICHDFYLNFRHYLNFRQKNFPSISSNNLSYSWFWAFLYFKSTLEILFFMMKDVIYKINIFLRFFPS